MKYTKLIKQIWNFSATYCCREEDIWNQFFLTIGGGYEWKNGELNESHPGHWKPKEKPQSIAANALDQAGEVHTKENASYWFDTFHVEYIAKRAAKKYINISSVDGSCNFNNLCKIPDDITDEYVGVVNSCLRWLSSIDEVSFIEKNEKYTKQMFATGSSLDEIKERELNKYPEWRKITDNYKCDMRNLSWEERFRYKNDEYDGIMKKIFEIVKKETEPKAIEYIKNNYKDLQKIIAKAKARLIELNKPLDLFSVPLVLETDTSIPDWYIKPEMRKEYELYKPKHGEIDFGQSCLREFTDEQLLSFLPK